MSIQNSASTAQICAFARAYVSGAGEDKVFDDFLAYDLIGKEEYDRLDNFVASDSAFSVTSAANTDQIIKEYLAPVTLSRICFTEDKLQAFAQEHGLCQYIICGAGYDTFSFRNGNPGIEVYEVDHPRMQAFKKKRIDELRWNIPPNVHFIAVDFEKDNFVEKLLGAGFDPKMKTVFSILGVAYYLTLPVFAKTVSYISQIASPGSMLVFDYPDEGIHNRTPRNRARTLSLVAKNLGETMRGGYYFDDLYEALRSEDFKMESHLASSDIGTCFFKGKQDDLQAIDHIYLVSAVKKEDINYHL